MIEEKENQIKDNLLQEQTTITQRVKIAILGSEAVGKSSLTSIFINCNAPDDHDPTIEDTYKTILKIHDSLTEVEILDTSGKDNYQSMKDKWINLSEGFLLVFALNDPSSYEKSKQTYHHIIKLKKNQQVPIIFVGNKDDSEVERKVEYFEVKSLSDSLGAEYVETSVKRNTNCKQVIAKISEMVLEAQIFNRVDNSRKCCSCCSIM